MKLQHEFEVPASPAETFALLLDPERVVPCMPGATLVEIVDDATWKTTMAVKLGPVGMDFVNDVSVVEQDNGAGTVLLSVRGRDTRGRGGVYAGVHAQLDATDSGGTRVTMETNVTFSGQAAQLGRPAVIHDVSTRLVDDFARRIGAQLGTVSEPAEPVSGPREGGTT